MKPHGTSEAWRACCIVKALVQHRCMSAFYSVLTLVAVLYQVVYPDEPILLNLSFSSSSTVLL